jgi:NAD(P)-dependent dehydrogenase (short-subunit alcohol dehydrogenase family)
MKEFKGKTVVVTGAASGIGYALAERFAQEKMNVVLADIEQDALDAAVAKICDLDVKAVGIAVDVMDKNSVQSLAKQSIDAFGNIHILCNNAGVAPPAIDEAIWDHDQNGWDWVMGVNFYGILYGIQSFLPHMIEHKEEGHVLNTVSMAGILGLEGSYGVSKFAALALSEGLWQSLKKINSKIGASALCPGFVATNLIDSQRNRPEHLSSKKKSNFLLKQLAASVLKRGKKPDEIAARVIEAIQANSFYILPHASYDEMIKERYERILARTEPETVDMKKAWLGSLLQSEEY